MTVSVVIPWRPIGCPYREAALEHVLRQFPSSWEIIISEDPTPDHFIKGEAVRVGVEKATGDVVVMHDGDLLTMPRLRTAVHAVEHGAAWAMPMSMVCRLTEEKSAAVLKDGLDPFADPVAVVWPGSGNRPRGRGSEPPSWLAERPYTYEHEAGGCMIATRRTLLEIPIDRRYTGYGAEDESHGMALTMLRGKVFRTAGPCFHLWHPPQDRPGRNVLSPENTAIRKRYTAAWMKQDRFAMRRLIAETLAL